MRRYTSIQEFKKLCEVKIDKFLLKENAVFGTFFDIVR